MAKATKGKIGGLDRFTEAQFEPYVKAIGQLVLSWNSLHETLGWSFEALLVGGSHPADNYKGPQARQAWNALNSDRDKRKLFAAAAANLTETEKRKFPKYAADVKWILDRADELENMRNNIVHSPLMLISSKKGRWSLSPAAGTPDYIVPAWLSGNQRALNLRGLLLKDRQLLAEFRWCRDAILTCRDFMVHVNRAWNSSEPSWPERPSLPPRKDRSTQLHRGPRVRPAVQKRPPQ